MDPEKEEQQKQSFMLHDYSNVDFTFQNSTKQTLDEQTSSLGSINLLNKKNIVSGKSIDFSSPNQQVKSILRSKQTSPQRQGTMNSTTTKSFTCCTVPELA